MMLPAKFLPLQITMCCIGLGGIFAVGTFPNEVNAQPAQKTVCLNGEIPAGMGIVEYTSIAECTKSADGTFKKNAWVLRKLGSTADVCLESPIPEDYEKVETFYSIKCSRDRYDFSRSKNTITIKRKTPAKKETLPTVTKPSPNSSFVPGFTKWMSATEFQAFINNLDCQQCYPSKIEGRVRTDGKNEYRANLTGWPANKKQLLHKAHFGLELKRFQELEQTKIQEGFKQASVQTFTDGNGVMRFQAVWIK